MSKRKTVLLAALLITAVSAAGCEGCGEKPEKEPEPDTKDVQPSEPQEDPLAGASKKAEESAVSRAIDVTDTARYLAGNMEAKKAPEREPVDHDPAPEKTTGSISAEKLNEVFRKHSGETQECYERRLKTNPALAGRIVLTLTIGSDGSVARADAVGDTLLDEDVIDCVESRAREWAFPEPDGGAAKVRKPFNFSPKR